MSDVTTTPEKWRDIEKSKYQEIRDLTDIVKSEYRKYMRNTILFKTIPKCIEEDSSLPAGLAKKVLSVFYSTEVEGSMNIRSDLRLLGLHDRNVFDLSDEERCRLRKAFGNTLIKSNKNIKQQLNEIEGVTFNDCRELGNLSIEDKIPIDLKRQLDDLQNRYAVNLLTLYNSLEEILLVRMNDANEKSNLKMKECSLLATMYSLRSRIITEKVRINIFTETNIALDAYKELFKDIHAQQNLLREKIEDLELLKEKYKQVSCKEYDEILKSYVSYKRDLEVKKLILKQTETKCAL